MRSSSRATARAVRAGSAVFPGGGSDPRKRARNWVRSSARSRSPPLNSPRAASARSRCSSASYPARKNRITSSGLSIPGVAMETGWRASMRRPAGALGARSRTSRATAALPIRRCNDEHHRGRRQGGYGARRSRRLERRRIVISARLGASIAARHCERSRPSQARHRPSTTTGGHIFRTSRVIGVVTTTSGGTQC